MAWDRPSRSLVGIDRLHDGAQLQNKIKFFPGQGGPPVPVMTIPASVARYGEYWKQAFFTGQNIPPAVELLALAQAVLCQAGKTTIIVSPTPSRSPIPFVEYGLGDRLPIYASNRFREAIGPVLGSGEWIDLQRVFGISVDLPDDQAERVDRLLLAEDS